MFNIFLSWSGPISHAVAELFHKELRKFLPGAEPWISSDNIPKGKPWFATIMNQITKSPEGIFFITKENLRAPWLYYEAGGVAVALPDASVCTLLLDVVPSDIAGTPLAPMQATFLNKKDVWRLIRDINSRLLEPTPENEIQGIFNKKWPPFEKKIWRILAGDAIADEVLDDDTPELADKAKELLMEASKDDYGGIMFNTNFEGFNVITNGKHFCDTESPREEAEWKALVGELVANGLVKDQNGKGELFELTTAGFKLADTLKPAAEAQKRPPPVTYSDTDLENKLHRWFGQQGFKGGTETITFADVDSELIIPTGSTKRLLAKPMADYNYFPVDGSIGDISMRIRHIAPATSAPSISRPGDNPRNPFRRR